MANHSKPVIAAFDFDGTLTYGDSLLPFLHFIAGNTATMKGLLLEVPVFLKYLVGKSSRQQVKEALLTRFLKGFHREQIAQYAEKFARHIIPSKLRPGAIDRIQWHKGQGHRCILVSANLDLYLVPWGTISHFDDVIASRVEFSKDGQITGHLEGVNCRGVEKVRRLLEKVGARDNFILYAYGDSRGDKELLECADFPYYRTLN